MVLGPLDAGVLERAARDQREARGERRDEPAAKRIVLGQFLAAALAALCRETDISPGLLGGPGDVRDLVAWRLGERDETDPPALAVGWRAELIGRRLEDLLEGRLSVHIRNALDEQPLAFEQRVDLAHRAGSAVPEHPQDRKLGVGRFWNGGHLRVSIPTADIVRQR